MKYAIISEEKISKCLFCRVPDCSLCWKYDQHDNIKKIIYSSLSLNDTYTKFREHKNPNKYKNYHIHKISKIDPNNIEYNIHEEVKYGILETVFLIENRSILSHEIINISATLKPIISLHKLIITGKIQTNSHFAYQAGYHWSVWNIIKISKALPTFNL
ncbi:MAG: hypothetical protein HFK06_00505 [Clostridia bacterium]|jgi:hypothetical protein|nr:hypothetical protein [Clostridia bacterium]